MRIGEAEIAAGLAVTANQLGLSSTGTITLSVNDGDNSFSCIYGQNGLQNFSYGNSQAMILSKDNIFIYGGLLILLGLAVGVILKNK